jgi:HK97 family phage prohead protease
MNAKKREIRTVDCRLSIREQAQGQEGESRTITGTAIVFNAESEILDDWGDKFREVVLPEAATMEFLKTQDIKMNMLHDRQLTIARSNKGVGSLQLSVDREGVHFEFEAPKCDLGDRCLEMVRRGDYSGCSFEFWPKDYEVERGGDMVTIKHKAFEFISALTIGMDPAYKQTSVSARELRDDKPEEEKPVDEAPVEEAPKDEEPKDDKAQEDQEREARIEREYQYRKRKLQIESVKSLTNNF